MKKIILTVLFVTTLLQADNFDDYLNHFDYQARKEMKIRTPEMLKLVHNGQAQFIDIRFKEEFEAWHMGFAKNIPLNELPKRLNELDKSKLIITACPHNDRANIARMYLHLKGYKVKYLSDGLLSSAEFLRGDNAKNFIKGKKQ